MATGAFAIALSAIISALLSQNAIAATGIHKTINFQGKVVNSDGTNVANGTYQFQFKLYTVSSGGTATWTETKNVAVTDGIFQTELGDTTSLPGSVDFNTDNIYLGINFNPGTGLDGEMSPRIRFTSSPYAFNSDLLDGLDSSAFAQLSPGSAQSGFLNVTGNVTSGATVAAATSIQAPLVDTATAVALGVGTGTASSVTVGRATAATNLTLQGSASTSWSATGASGSTTVNFANPTATNTITFPNAGGTVCTTVASTCSATYLASGAYLAKNAADTSTFAVTAANYLYGLTNSSSAVASGVLQLTNGTNTGDALYVTASGNPGAGNALIVANNTNGAPSGNLIDLQIGAVSQFAVASSGNVTQVGGSSTTSTINGQRISAAANFTGTVTAATGLTVTAGATSLTGATSGDALTVSNSTSTGNIAVFKDNATAVATFANGGAVTFQNSSNSTAAFKIQNAGGTPTTIFNVDSTNTRVTLRAASGSNGEDVSVSSGTGTLQIGADTSTNIAFDENEIMARNNGSASTLYLQNEGGGLNSRANSTVFQGTTDSTTAFQILDQDGGNPVLNVDTTNERLGIGIDSPLTVLQAHGPLVSVANNQFYNVAASDNAAAAQYVGGGIGFVGNADTQRVFGVIQGYHESSTASNYNGALRFLTRTNGSDVMNTQLTIGSNGATAFTNSANSANAFQIQNAAGRSLLNVNSSTGSITLGNITSTSGQGVAGSLVLADGTNDNFGLTLNTTTLTANRTITFPNAGGTVCLESAATCGFIVGSSASFIQNQNASQQVTSNYWISGTGRADTSVLTPLIATADVATGTSGSLVLRSGNGTAGGASSGNVTLDTGSKNGAGFAGNLYLGNANALSVNIGRNAVTASGTTVAIKGLAATSSIIVNDGTNTNQTTISFTTPTAARAINFPDASGAICLDSGNCGGATGYILNQTGTNQTASFQITGTGRANNQLQAPLFDTPSGTTTLNIGTNNATAGINLNQNTTIATGKSLTVTSGALTQSGGAVSLAGNAASSLTTTSGALTITSAAATNWSTSAGDLAVYAAGNLNLGGSGGGTVNIGAVGTSTSASTIHIADTSNATGAQSITVGSGANASSLTTIQGGTAASGGVVLSATTVGLSATNLQFASGGARNILVAQAGAGAGNDLTVSAGQGASGQTGGNLTLQAGANGTASGTPGSVIVKSNGGNSTSAFDVQNATNVSQFKVDTANSQIITPGLTIQSANITPNTAMTVGSTTQAFTMQGSGTSTITATNASSTTALIFQTPTANVNYQFKTTTAGTYTVCTTELSSCGTGSTGYLRKGVANETSNANLTVANDLLYTFSNSGSAQTGVLKVDNGAGTGSALQVTSAANPAAGKALIFANDTLNNATGNLIDLWSTQSSTSASRFSVSATGAVTSSTINGQTIAATSQLAVLNTSGLVTANSLTVTNTATFNSGLTVNSAALVANAGASIFNGINNNAGGITSAGAISGLSSLQFNTAGTIDANSAVSVSIGATNASSVNIGRAGGTLSLQGNASSGLSVTNGTTSTSLQFVNPTNNIVYQFATGTGGTYQICSTLASTCGNTYAAYYANGYVQLAPTVAQGDASANPSIFITKSSAGYLMRLQSSSTDVFSVHSNGTLTSSGTAYLGGTSASYGLQMDTTNFKVRVGTGTPTLGGGGSNANAALFVSGSAEFAGTIRVGDGTNNATYDGTTKEVTYNGTARHAKTIRLTAEYAGAVLDADGSNNTGTMTAALDQTPNPDMPYYKWTTGQSTSQDYDVVVSVPIPDDWAAWNGNPTFNIYRSNASGAFAVSIYQTSGTIDSNFNAFAIAPAGNGAWTAYSSRAFAGTYTAGGYMTVRIKMTAPQNEHVRLGTLEFPYLSKW